MSTIDSVAAGLIGAGALVLLLTLLELPPQLPGTLHLHSDVTRLRRDRTARTGARVGAVSTLIGAAMLVASGRAWVAIGSAACVLVAARLALGRAVATHYRQIAPMLYAFRGRPKTPSTNVVALVGLGTWIPGGSRLPADVDVEEAIRRAKERSSFARALLHPFGYRDSL
jgi:hypothetical protein